MWTVSECDTDVQIIPTGEETYHSWTAECPCHPKVFLQRNGKMRFEHKNFDEENLEEMLDIAYESPLFDIRQELDC